MNELAWLGGHRFQSVTRREFDWVFVFDREASIVVACLWRLLEGGCIRCTSEDDGKKFGRPAPVDAAAEVNGRLVDVMVEDVDLRQGVLDLELRFSTGQAFQVIPDSSRYESWIAYAGDREFIAGGGGKLTIFEGGDG